jgi:hypothetical protein
MTLLQVDNHDRYKCLDIVVHDKLMSFLIDYVDVFKGWEMVLLVESKISLFSIWKTFKHDTPHQFSGANFISNPYCETRRGLAFSPFIPSFLIA